MSMEALGRFLEGAADDSELAERLKVEVGDHKGDEALAAVAAVAQQRGFDVVAEDVAQLRSMAGRSPGGEDGDLSDAELDQVSGGDAFMSRVMMGAMTLGLSELFR